MADTSKYYPNSLPMNRRLYNGSAETNNIFQQHKPVSVRQSMVNGSYNSVPDLLPKRRVFHLTNRSQQPQQTIPPMYAPGSELERFNRIPNLCPIKPQNQSIYSKRPTIAQDHAKLFAGVTVRLPMLTNRMFSTDFLILTILFLSFLFFMQPSQLTNELRSIGTNNIDKSAYQALLDKVLGLKQRKYHKHSDDSFVQSYFFLFRLCIFLTLLVFWTHT